MNDCVPLCTADSNGRKENHSALLIKLSTHHGRRQDRGQRLWDLTKHWFHHFAIRIIVKPALET